MKEIYPLRGLFINEAWGTQCMRHTVATLSRLPVRALSLYADLPLSGNRRGLNSKYAYSAIMHFRDCDDIFPALGHKRHRSMDVKVVNI